VGGCWERVKKGVLNSGIRTKVKVGGAKVKGGKTFTDPQAIVVKKQKKE